MFVCIAAGILLPDLQCEMTSIESLLRKRAAAALLQQTLTTTPKTKLVMALNKVRAEFGKVYVVLFICFMCMITDIFILLYRISQPAKTVTV
jgi:hypothetical protein